MRGVLWKISQISGAPTSSFSNSLSVRIIITQLRMLHWMSRMPWYFSLECSALVRNQSSRSNVTTNYKRYLREIPFPLEQESLSNKIPSKQKDGTQVWIWGRGITSTRQHFQFFAEIFLPYVADSKHDKILAIARAPCPKSQWEGNFHKDTQPSEEKEYHTRRARYVDISKFQNIWATCSNFHTKLNLKKLICQLLRARMATSPISWKPLLCAIAFSDILNPLTKHEQEERSIKNLQLEIRSKEYSPNWTKMWTPNWRGWNSKSLHNQSET